MLCPGTSKHASFASCFIRLRRHARLASGQLFNKQNCILATFAQDNVELPFPKPVFPDLAPTAFNITNVAGVITLKLTCPSDTGPNTVLRASAPQSSGRWSVP